MPRIAIHGFGRIGRSLLRVALKDKLFVPVSISDIKDVPTLAALFEVDSNYGRWPEEVTAKDSCFVVGGREIPYFDSTKALPNWKALGVDLVIDCTGRASTRPGAQAHLDAGAKRVLISAPSKKREDCDAVLLPGINLDTFDPGKHKIVSLASCTTNALAPVVKVVIENFGIKYGLFSTIHAYTKLAGADRPADEGSPRFVGRHREHHPLFIRRRARARVHLEGPQASRARPTASPHAPAASPS